MLSHLSCYKNGQVMMSTKGQHILVVHCIYVYQGPAYSTLYKMYMYIYMSTKGQHIIHCIKCSCIYIYIIMSTKGQHKTYYNVHVYIGILCLYNFVFVIQRIGCPKKTLIAVSGVNQQSI